MNNFTVISRTPVRFSLSGGGTDLDSYFLKYGGMAISLTIDKYIYVIVNADQKTQICTAHEEEKKLPKAALKRLGLKTPANIMVSTTLRGGTGLGTGGAITVGLVRAITAFNGQKWAKDKIADIAYRIEREDLKLSCGKKDQYSTCFGGLNLMKFNANDSVEVIPIKLKSKILNELKNHLLLFDTGKTRNSEKILKKQNLLSKDKIVKGWHYKKIGTDIIYKALLAGDLEKIGRQMTKNWQIKRKIVPGISNKIIDLALNNAIRAGAWGGRISGAGGGGFLVIFCPPKYHDNLKNSLNYLSELKYNFDSTGTQIIYQEN